MSTATGDTIFDVYFDDVEIGGRHRTQNVRICPDEVRRFADLSGDYHPLHIDPEYGARSMFGSNVVQGMHIMSRGTGMVPLNPGRTLVLRKAEGVFKRPILVDQPFYVATRISDKEELTEDLGLVGVVMRICSLPLDAPDDDLSEGKLAARGKVWGLWARTPAAFGNLDLARYM